MPLRRIAINHCMRNTRRAVALATFAQCARAMSSSALSGRGMKAAGYVGTASKSMAMRDEGRDLITLAVAQNALMDDLLLPKVAQAAARASARVRYAPSWLGLPELRAGVARLYSSHVLRDNLVTADEVAITSSATSAIDALLFAVLEKGDAVLTVAPFYGSYTRDVEARAECVLVPVPGATDGVPTVESLEEHFQWREPRPKALLVASPHNPCGSVLGAQTLKDMVSWTRLRNVQLIVDEVFALSTFEPGAFTSVLDVLDAAEDNAHVHVVYSASKDLALSGYRVGALITKNPAVLDSFKCLSIFCNAATLPQAVVAELLDDDAWLGDAWIPELRSRLKASWRHAKKHCDAHALRRLGSDPEAGHFCLLDLRGVAEGPALNAALEKAGVVLTPGPLMGAPHGIFRLCHAAEPDARVAEAVARIAGVVNAAPPLPEPPAGNTPTCKAPAPGCAQS